MKSVRLKYKDYAFPKNPKSIVITSSKHLSENKINGYRTQTTEICKNPCNITVSGEITQNINEETEKLKKLQNEKNSGFLQIPYADTYDAFFEKIEFKISANSEKVIYNAVFRENQKEKLDTVKITKTTVLKDENLFDISARTGVSVENLIEINNLKSPFDIKENQEVILYESTF